MPRLLELRNNQRAWVNAPAPISQTLRFVPDAVQAHAADLGSVLSPRGTGVAWVGVRPVEAMSGAFGTGALGTSGTLLQVTNLGVSVKDSPQTTLVFVTRLDNAAPVEGAAVAIVDTANRERWRGTTDRDGVAIAPAMALRTDQQPVAVVVCRDGGEGRRPRLRRVGCQQRSPAGGVRPPI